MTNISIFIIELFKRIKEDDIISKAGDLTFKMLLSLFPFILFLMALASYFEIDVTVLIDGMYQGLPADIVDFIAPFMIELFEIRRPQMLSISFLIMLFSASGGFNTAMKGINKAHGHIDERNFFHRRLISIALVLVFAVAIISAMIMLIFNNTIYNFAMNHLYNTAFLNVIFSFFGYLVSIGILLFSVIIINSLSLAKKKHFSAILPGASVTVVCWVLLSRAFSVYVNNFSNHSALYGSVAGIMLFLIWLNLVCTFMLIGSEINAIINVKN